MMSVSESFHDWLPRLSSGEEMHLWQESVRFRQAYSPAAFFERMREIIYAVAALDIASDERLDSSLIAPLYPGLSICFGHGAAVQQARDDPVLFGADDEAGDDRCLSLALANQLSRRSAAFLPPSDLEVQPSPNLWVLSDSEGGPSPLGEPLGYHESLHDAAMMEYSFVQAGYQMAMVG